MGREKKVRRKREREREREGGREGGREGARERERERERARARARGREGGRERERERERASEQLLRIQLETIRSRFGFVPCFEISGLWEDSEVSGHIAIGAIGKAPTHIWNAVAQGVHGPGTGADGHLVLPWLFRSQRCRSILMAPGRTESKRRFENTRKKNILWLYYGCYTWNSFVSPQTAKGNEFVAGCSPKIVVGQDDLETWSISRWQRGQLRYRCTQIKHDKW